MEMYRKNILMKKLLFILFFLPLFASAQITYHNSSSQPADNGTQAANTTVTVTPPASMVAGDLVIVHFSVRNTTGTLTNSTTGGQSWTSETEHASGDSRIFWCRYNGTWTVDPVFSTTAGGGTVPGIVTMHVFRPTVSSNTWAIDVAQATSSATSGTTQTITGVTTVAANTVSFALWNLADDATWGTLTGTGWVVLGTAQYRNTTGSDLSTSYAYQIKTSAGATNNTSKTSSIAASGSIPFLGHIISFKEVTASNIGTMF